MLRVFWRGLSKSLMDYTFLFVLTFSSIYNLSLLYRPDPADVNQLDSFEELVKTVLDCHNTEITTDEHHHGTNNSSIPPQDPKCPIDDERLKYFDDYKIETWLHYHHVEYGGRFKPIGCVPTQKVAIVIPFRDRQEQLDKFTLYMHQFLPDQLIDYTIYVIEQLGEDPFNRAKLFNIGASEIRKLRDDICCFIFHDVDLMPLDQRNLYMCTENPRHMSSAVSNMRYQLLYPQLFGGVVAMTTEQYDSIGGFSNEFSGWGGEDDDMFGRVVGSNYQVERSPLAHGLYIMLQHEKMVANPDRFELLNKKNGRVIPLEATYTLKKTEIHQLYTKLAVAFI